MCTCVTLHTVGVQGIVSAYQMCISQVALHGPTNFAPIIYHVAQFAAAAKNEPTPKVCHSSSLYVFINQPTKHSIV